MSVRGRAIRLSTLIKLAVGVWIVAEGLAFYLVGEAIGYPEALLIAFATSLFGWTLLKRAGVSAMIKLRALLDSGRMIEGASIRFADETLASIGALALLLPGFLSDAIGLVLTIPSVRDRLSRSLGGPRGPAFRTSGGEWRPPSSRTIDLEPGEWRRGEASQRPAPKP